MCEGVTALYHEARPKERSDRVRFLPFKAKKALNTGVRTGCYYLV